MDKIIFFHQRNDFTGSSRVLANVIESEYSSQSVSVITINNNEGFLSSLPNVRLIPIYFPFSKRGKIPIVTPLVWRLHALLLTLFYGWRYDTFYINTITPYYAAIVGRLYRKNLIYHIHEKFVSKSITIKMYEYIFNHVRSKRIFVSEYVKKQYPDKEGCESIVKYNTLPNSFLSQVISTPIEIRNRNRIIMISSLTKAKGIFTYVEVARQLPEYHFRLLISADMDRIKAFLDCSLPANVELVPAQSDIHPFLRDSDLMMNLSIPVLWIETFGMTILEAMAYGIPAIVPNVGGPVELVENGYNGYCVDVTDISIVTDAVRMALSENEYQRLAHNAFCRFQMFT